MTTSVFPGALDPFSNPSPSTPQTLHAEMHTEENDGIVALQTKVGITGSADATSLDYKVAHSLKMTSNLSDLASAATARANLGVSPVLIGTGDNGITDNYASFNTQITAFAALGYQAVRLPATTGYYGVSQDLVLPQGVWLVGDGAFRQKSPGSTGAITYGSGIGPYTAGSTPAVSTFTNGVVQLVNRAGGLRNLAVIGINTASPLNSAPCAVYVSGTSTSTAPRAYDCLFWGGLISVLWAHSYADDFYMGNCELNNGTFSGIQSVPTFSPTTITASPTLHGTATTSITTWTGGANVGDLTVGNVTTIPATNGLIAIRTNSGQGWGMLRYATASGTTIAGCYLVAGSGQVVQGATGSVGAIAGANVITSNCADVRFSEVQSFNGSWVLGPVGGSDFKMDGGHISSAANGCPSLWLGGGATSSGGGFTNMTVDNGVNALSAHVERWDGTWAFGDCRFQQGSTFASTTFAGTNGATLSTLSTLTLGATVASLLYPSQGHGAIVTSGGSHTFTWSGATGSTLTGCQFDGVQTDTVATAAAISVGYPVFRNQIDNTASGTVTVGDPLHGFLVSDIHMSLSSGTPFLGLVNYLGASLATPNSVDNISTIHADSSSITNLWLLNGTATSSTTPIRATGVVINQTLQTAIPAPSIANLYAAPAAFTFAYGAAAGTGPTGGTWSGYAFSFTLGTATVSGILVTITHSLGYVPNVRIVQPESASMAIGRPYVISASTTTIVIGVQVAPTASAAASFDLYLASN